MDGLTGRLLLASRYSKKHKCQIVGELGRIRTISRRATRTDRSFLHLAGVFQGFVACRVGNATLCLVTVWDNCEGGDQRAPPKALSDIRPGRPAHRSGGGRLRSRGAPTTTDFTNRQSSPDVNKCEFCSFRFRTDAPHRPRFALLRPVQREQHCDVLQILHFCLISV